MTVEALPPSALCGSLQALQSILMATDLSASSRHAAARAAALARSSGARLSFLHVVHGSPLDALRRLAGVQQGVDHDLQEAARHALHRLSQQDGLDIQELLAGGAVVEEIIGAAQRLAADLLVVGAHSTETVLQRFLGSTSARLLRVALHSVLLVRLAPAQPYRRVLVPLDFSPWTAATIELARRVAPGAHLVLMHAWELPFEGALRRADVEAEQLAGYRQDFEVEVRQRLARVAADHRLAEGDWTAVAAHGPVRLCIREAGRAHRCDLVGIGKHGSNYTGELLLGSVTHRVAEEWPGDVLVSTGRDPV